MKKIISLALAFILSITSVFAVNKIEILGIEVDSNSIIKFSDDNLISADKKEYITLATALGIISGSDGKFNPKDNVTRAEFTKIIAEMLDYNVNVQYNNIFSDVNSGDWYAKYVQVASNKGVINGSNGNFRPNDNITTEEMAVILTRALNVQPKNYNFNLNDLSLISDYAKNSIGFMLEKDILTDKDGYIQPKNIVNREFATETFMKSYLYLNNVDDMNIKKSISKTTNYLLEKVKNPTLSVLGGDWAVFGLAISGEEIPKEYYENYYSNIEKAVLSEHNKETRKFSNKVTETQRVSIALKASGYNPLDVNGVNLVDYTLNKYENMPDLPSHQQELGDRQGINELIFGLITLDLVYDETQVNESRVEITDKILNDYRTLDGGFSLGKNGDKIDIDITAMTITALSPYYNQKGYEEVTKAIDECVELLSDLQHQNGSFSNEYSTSSGVNTENSESIAQVVIALSSIGIDSHLDSRFVKNGNSAIDAMYEYYLENGSFEHIKGDNGSQMATEQSYLALIAYDRFQNGQSSIYDIQ